MQAIILAAGMGKRLKELTQNNTKCMVKVNGVTLIERMLRQIGALQPYDPVIDPAVAHFFHQGPGVVARHGLQADLNVFGKVERAPGHPN